MTPATGADRLDPAVIPPIEIPGRLARVRDGLDGHGADALVVTTPANIRWLTGFSGSAGVLVVTATGALLTSDGRYRTQAAEQLEAAGVGADVEVSIGGVAAQRAALSACLGAAGAGRVGLEAGDVTWAGMQAWQEALGDVELVATRGVVEELRIVKTPGEVARIERAAAIADAALGQVLPLLSGADGSVTELRFAAALDHAMRELGAEASAFETIVASGENSAKPHARPAGRAIVAGDPVVVDFGAIYDGYRSDMTRTFCVGGEPRGQLARVFAVVGEAQRDGVDAVAPGVEAGDVDRVCRDRIAAAGWAEWFEHGTGHGVGLDIHEAPSVAPGSTAILAPGVVATVEPGVYLPGIGGVRIEDTLVVTPDGRRALTTFTKELAV